MKIYSFRSPYIFRQFFKWIFWRQLRRNRCEYKRDCYDEFY